MRKPVKTQWDFGELFATPASKPPQEAAVEPVPAPEEPVTPKKQVGRKILSVSELTGQIRRLLENQIGLIWVTGEITNFKSQNSGHIYFTLKDANAQLSCVLFRGESQVDRSLLKDGAKTNMRGELTVFEVRGQYQLRVTAIELQGVGALQIAFEKLKQKLNAEGLFAQARKRALPRFPQRIGLVTSPTGAAIRDVLHVIERRNPGLQLILAPCRVQGDGAALEIVASIRLLNEYHLRLIRETSAGLDLILLTRGGGSLEDLWAFNEEIVARAIFESKLPIVSAVGHEIDITISDFVADVRAATPSAAAEIITEGVFSSCQFVSEAAERMRQLATQQIADKEYVLDQARQRLARMHPRRRFNDWVQRLDELNGSLARCAKQGARRQRVAWQNLAERLSRVKPSVLLRQRREVFEQKQSRLRELGRHHLERCRSRLESARNRLRLLGPEQVLSRGYSITMDETTGKIIRVASEVKSGQTLITKVKTGAIKSTVHSTHETRDGEERGSESRSGRDNGQT